MLIAFCSSSTPCSMSSPFRPSSSVLARSFAILRFNSTREKICPFACTFFGRPLPSHSSISLEVALTGL